MAAIAGKSRHDGGPAAGDLDILGLSRRLQAAAGELAQAQRAEGNPRIAVLLPCHNEAAAIAGVIAGFAAALPQARIVVFDNLSSDGTAEIARAAGAEVIAEPRKGKGHVVRRMFAEIDADIYLMADGDGTYDSTSAPRLIAAMVEGRLDMVVGARAQVMEDAHRRGHAFGNRLFNALYKLLFGSAYGDIFSGYRVFSRRFVKSFPALSQGFEIETELSVHASQIMAPVGEMALPYGKRVEGSASKLRSVRDGLRILRTFGSLLKETRPRFFYGVLAGVVALAAVLLSAPLAVTYLETGLVPRLPTAVLAVGMMLMAALLATCGLILDSIAKFRVEQKRIAYLAAGSLDRL